VLPGDIYVYEERGALAWTIKNGPDVGDYTGWIVYPYNTKVYFVTLADVVDIPSLYGESSQYYHYIMSYQELKKHYIEQKENNDDGDIPSRVVHSATLLPEPVLTEGRLLPGGYFKEMMPKWDEEGNLVAIIPAECPGPQDRFPDRSTSEEGLVWDQEKDIYLVEIGDTYSMCYDVEDYTYEFMTHAQLIHKWERSLNKHWFLDPLGCGYFINRAVCIREHGLDGGGAFEVLHEEYEDCKNDKRIINLHRDPSDDPDYIENAPLKTLDDLPF
jgi:hypothetical protein